MYIDNKLAYLENAASNLLNYAVEVETEVQERLPEGDLVKFKCAAYEDFMDPEEIIMMFMVESEKEEYSCTFRIFKEQVKKNDIPDASFVVTQIMLDKNILDRTWEGYENNGFGWV